MSCSAMSTGPGSTAGSPGSNLCCSPCGGSGSRSSTWFPLCWSGTPACLSAGLSWIRCRVSSAGTEGPGGSTPGQLRSSRRFSAAGGFLERSGSAPVPCWFLRLCAWILALVLRPGPSPSLSVSEFREASASALLTPRLVCTQLVPGPGQNRELRYHVRKQGSWREPVCKSEWRDRSTNWLCSLI